MLMVDLIIILSHLKLDIFYFTGVMNQFEIIYYDLFLTILWRKCFFFFKNFILIFLYNNELLLVYKTKTIAERNRFHCSGGKERAAEYYIVNKEFLKENANNK